MKIKRDKYLQKRGGTAKIMNVSCVKCGNSVLVYQKDGPGWLKRCYLNRIIAPPEFACLQHNSLIKEPKDLGNLRCKCGEVIGFPVIHKDKRLAFHLFKGKFKRSPYKEIR
jgi:hypothetical protein